MRKTSWFIAKERTTASSVCFRNQKKWNEIHSPPSHFLSRNNSHRDNRSCYEQLPPNAVYVDINHCKALREKKFYTVQHYLGNSQPKRILLLAFVTTSQKTFRDLPIKCNLLGLFNIDYNCGFRDELDLSRTLSFSGWWVTERTHFTKKRRQWI